MSIVLIAGASSFIMAAGNTSPETAIEMLAMATATITLTTRGIREAKLSPTIGGTEDGSLIIAFLLIRNRVISTLRIPDTILVKRPDAPRNSVLIPPSMETADRIR